MAGAQAAWEMFDGEIQRVKDSITLLAVARDEERDAENYSRDQESRKQSDTLKQAFLAGRRSCPCRKNAIDPHSFAEKIRKAERERCAHSADLMQHDVRTGETWDEALRRHKHRILNPPKPGGEE